MENDDAKIGASGDFEVKKVVTRLLNFASFVLFVYIYQM